MRGHQPFFLGAAVFALLAMSFWLGVLDLAMPNPARVAPAQWHAHEMLFGYTIAVLAGFLLTASTGWQPVAAFVVWFFGRVAMAFAAELPPGLVAVADLAFAPMLALLRSPPLWSGFKWPTVGFLPLLLCIFLANLLWHLEAIGVLSDGAQASTFLAVDLFTLMMVVMAGRLVPGYTRAMLIPIRKPKDPAREQASIALGIALLLSDQLHWSTTAGSAALALGGLQAWRLAGWRTQDVLRRPILLVLHLGDPRSTAACSQFGRRRLVRDAVHRGRRACRCPVPRAEHTAGRDPRCGRSLGARLRLLSRRARSNAGARAAERRRSPSLASRLGVGDLDQSARAARP
jgi:uncharacterized protein involved in response to NO